METKDIFILVAVISFLGFSFYRKYMKKKTTGQAQDKDSQSGSWFSSHSKDDDYEPYSGKK
jgi:beta-glucosidase/6-phospho-beta-glucosidase/beta-galactosidase